MKANLVAEERAQILKRFPGYKKVARVVMGEPSKEQDSIPFHGGSRPFEELLDRTTSCG